MPPSSPASATCSRRLVTPRRRTQAPRQPSPPPPGRKLRSISEILQRDNYKDVVCEQCGSGDRPAELLLCDKCDKGFHMKCVRPIVAFLPMGSWLCPDCSGWRRVTRLSQKKIIDFFGIQKTCNGNGKCGSPQETRKHRRHSLVYQKKRRRLLPFVPSEDPGQRFKQMGSLASALTTLHMEYTDDLVYSPSMAPRNANQAEVEEGGMQVLPKEDTETLEQCKAMCKGGECPPLIVVYDSCEGFTVEADGLIKDMTFLTEYTGDVDYTQNREHDDGDSMMSLLLATDKSKSLVICPDKRGNIARFISGINNHTLDGKKKQNCKCVRYNVNGECRVFLVATRGIVSGERLYYDYNGYEHEYPTEHFL